MFLCVVVVEFLDERGEWKEEERVRKVKLALLHGHGWSVDVYWCIDGVPCLSWLHLFVPLLFGRGSLVNFGPLFITCKEQIYHVA